MEGRELPEVKTQEDFWKERSEDEAYEQLLLDDSYVVERLDISLGTGGFSDVGLAKLVDKNSSSTARLVALKHLHVDEDDVGHARESLTWKEALCEPLILREISVHPNIIKCFGVTRDLESMRLVLHLEVAPYGSLGETLRDIDSFPDLPGSLTLAWLFDTADALNFLHKKGILYRDLNPENILLFPGLRVKLCDFGLSLMSVDVVCGTSGYIAWENDNEQAPASYSTDIFAFGVSALRIITRSFKKYRNSEQLLLLMNALDELDFYASLPSFTDHSGPELSLLTLLKECVSVNANDRPSAEMITKSIKHYLSSAGGDPRIDTERDDIHTIEQSQQEIARMILGDAFSSVLSPHTSIGH